MFELGKFTETLSGIRGKGKIGTDRNTMALQMMMVVQPCEHTKTLNPFENGNFFVKHELYRHLKKGVRQDDQNLSSHHKPFLH
jgi:hypothetical protein